MAREKEREKEATEVCLRLAALERIFVSDQAALVYLALFEQAPKRHKNFPENSTPWVVNEIASLG